MSILFNDLKQGLQEAIDIERGNLSGRKTVIEISPAVKFSGKEIRSIRLHSNMTQHSFATFMGVSQKTVESWERGATSPAGTACRLLELLNERGPESFPYVTVKK